MEHRFLRSLVVFFLYVTPHAWSAETDAAAPFALTVVPSLSRPKVKSIAFGNDKDFYVVLTNTSKEPQSVFEAWNSWGFAAVSFELMMPDGKKILVSRGTEDWPRNFPSTFLIPPGEHQVYVIRLDKRWKTRPELTGDIQIKLKAIYHVEVTKESTQHKVWTGRVESRLYDLTLERL